MELSDDGRPKKKVSKVMLEKLMEDKSIRVLDIFKSHIFHYSAHERIVLHLNFSVVIHEGEVRPL